MTTDDDELLNQFFHLDDVPSLKKWITQSNMVTFIEDLSNETNIDAITAKISEQSNIKSFACMPLRSGQRWQGSITFAWSIPHIFSSDERFILRQLLDPVAAVVASRRSSIAQQIATRESERLARREKAIREITEKMRAATSLEELVKTAASELGQRFSAEHVVVELGVGR
ncbi:MAG: hypothetical protein B6242_09530 [Anaerolineaceae bacterium 4572_78]|nr:MAG: hypothetical protein B6242_09530 [Anaerolineaceae bacterium 4572_78]